MLVARFLDDPGQRQLLGAVVPAPSVVADGGLGGGDQDRRTSNDRRQVSRHVTLRGEPWIGSGGVKFASAGTLLLRPGARSCRIACHRPTAAGRPRLP